MAEMTGIERYSSCKHLCSVTSGECIDCERYARGPKPPVTLVEAYPLCACFDPDCSICKDASWKNIDRGFTDGDGI